MIKSLSTIFARKPKFIGQALEHKVKHEFTLGGKKYYAFDEDIFFLPFRRGIVASMFYKELQCGVDREYLNWFTTQIDEVFKVNPNVGFDINKIMIVNRQLKDRLEFIFEPDLIYKLASVVYFDEDENPYNYSLAHGYKKIAFWKKNEAVNDFFLRQPIKKLIPFFKQDEKNILNYLTAAEKIKKQHTEQLSNKSFNKDMMSMNP